MVAPAFELWAKAEEAKDTARSARWQKELEEIKERVGALGILVMRDTGDDSYSVWFAEQAIHWPVKRGDLLDVHFAFRIDPRKQRWKLARLPRPSFPPKAPPGCFESLQRAVDVLLAHVKETSHKPFPKFRD